MAWTIELSKPAQKSLRKLDISTADRITRGIMQIAASENPRTKGIAMAGKYAGHWRYRIGDYRAIGRIKDDKLIIFVVEIGDRRDVYR